MISRFQGELLQSLPGYHLVASGVLSQFYEPEWSSRLLLLMVEQQSLKRGVGIKYDFLLHEPAKFGNVEVLLWSLFRLSLAEGFFRCAKRDIGNE